MAEYSSREKIDAIMKKENLGIVARGMLSIDLLFSHSKLSPKEVMGNAETYAKVVKDVSDDFGIDMNLGGMFMDFPVLFGSGLINKDGVPSPDGEEVVNKPEDIDKLHEPNINKSMALANTCANIKELKRIDPARPIFVGVDNPCMVGSTLMGAAVYYKAMRKNPQFIFDVCNLIVDPLKKGLNQLAEAGTDIIWVPMPTMGGTCVSKKNYIDYCSPYSKAVVDYVHELGMKIIIHTCGNWNDRFDVMAEEGPDVLHLSEAILPDYYRDYAAKMSPMGNISVVETLIAKDVQGVYGDCYQAALDVGGLGTYIMSPDCGMPAAVTEDKIRAMYQAGDDAARELFGK